VLVLSVLSMAFGFWYSRRMSGGVEDLMSFVIIRYHLRREFRAVGYFYLKWVNRPRLMRSDIN
jgi:hypothetical protein